MTGRFRAVFGRDPEVAWHAPGRVNLIGEHTDYNGGYVLPVALPLGVVAAASRTPGGTLRVASAQQPGPPVELRLDELVPGGVDGWPAYPAGVLWRMRTAGLPVGGVELLLDGELPRGAGLSSSAAVECAVATAVNELFGLGLDRETLAELARAAENDFVGMPCGVMDQYAALLCTAGHALFLDTRSLATEQVPVDFAEAGLALVLVDTGSPHRLVSSEYAARRRDCERAARELGVTALREVSDLAEALARLDEQRLRRRVRHVVTENERVLRVVSALRAGRLTSIGECLTASHESLRLDYQVSSREQDLAVRAALAVGALSARMTGGGFGGCVIVLAATSMLPDVVDAVSGAFARAGLPAPTCSTVIPGAGARRL